MELGDANHSNNHQVNTTSTASLITGLPLIRHALSQSRDSPSRVIPMPPRFCCRLPPSRGIVVPSDSDDPQRRGPSQPSAATQRQHDVQRRPRQRRTKTDQPTRRDTSTPTTSTTPAAVASSPRQTGTLAPLAAAAALVVRPPLFISVSSHPSSSHPPPPSISYRCRSPRMDGDSYAACVLPLHRL